MRVARVACRYEVNLAPRLERVQELVFTAGASPADDRVAFVRAASAVRRFGERLLIVQDDVRALALRSADGTTEALLLPAGSAGARTFDDARGNKRLKLDLEACLSLPDGGAVIFGSGSSPARERVVVVGLHSAPRVHRANAFYRYLRSLPEFAGSALNLEGAVVHGNLVRLFQRGNAKPRGALQPVNAIGDLPLDDFLAWLDADGPTPVLASILQVDAGKSEVAGTAFCFTDGAVLEDGRLAFIACAEASDGVLSDGPVGGVRFGIVDADGSIEIADVIGPDGLPTCIKLEGLESRPGVPRRLDVVADLDRADAPALIGELVFGS